MSFKELLDAIIKVCEGCNVIGCDVNELSPHYDQSGSVNCGGRKDCERIFNCIGKINQDKSRRKKKWEKY